MEINVKIMYDFDQIAQEMTGQHADDIMVLKAKDRFFVGYGCESSYSKELPSDLSSGKQYLFDAYQNSSKNISLCRIDHAQMK